MHKKLFALAAILAVLIPVMAAGRPACCIKNRQATAGPACCRAMSAQDAKRKGCCKPPAPRLDTTAKEDARLATTYSPIAVAVPAIVAFLAPEAPALRLARLGHRAHSADESPPDLLSRNSLLRI